jgi:hypothetical protein
MKFCYRAAFATAWLTVMSVCVPAWAETWCLTDLQASGLDENTQTTFLNIWQAEVMGRGEALIMGDEVADAACDRSVAMTIGRLGERIMVTVSWQQPVAGSAQASAMSPEELDVVAAQLATEMLAGGASVMTQRLGEITQADAQVDRRADLDSGFLFRVAAHVPYANSFLNGRVGPALEFGYWGEARHFAIETRTGFRFAAPEGKTNEARSGSMFMWNLDVAGLWLPHDGVISPYIGGGAGLRFTTANTFRYEETGDAIVQEQESVVRQGRFGVGSFVRVGALFLRTYKVRLSLHVDAEITWMNMGNQVAHPAILTGVGVHF